MPESIYQEYGYNPFEVPHQYGDNIHIVSDPVSLTRLSVLGRPDSTQPVVNWLIADCYRQLLVSAAANFPRRSVEVPTRMTGLSSINWNGEVIDPAVPVVTVGIARAGTWPAQICFDAMCQLLGPTHVRLDHLYMSRSVDENGSVQGTIITGHKVGGNVDNAVLLIPDPMGATAGTIVRAIKLYKDLGLGTPQKMIALHLIVTPEYIKRVNEEVPELTVYALRLDRGLSSEKALQAQAGTFLDEEKGLNSQDYIVPGLGGVGEIMNNSFV